MGLKTATSVEGGLCDVGIGTREIEAMNKLDRGYRSLGKPAMNGIDEIGKEFPDVGGELSNYMVFPKLLFADFVGFLASGLLIEKS